MKNTDPYKRPKYGRRTIKIYARNVEVNRTRNTQLCI